MSQVLQNHINSIKESYRVYLNIFGSSWMYLANKREGERCACFDKVREMAKKTCKLCEGTGFAIGLNPPVTVKCSKLSTSQALDQGIIPQQQFANDKQAIIWTIDDIDFFPGDFMISDIDQVYEVVSSAPSLDAGHLRTILTLTRIPESNESAKRVREAIQ